MSTLYTIAAQYQQDLALMADLDLDDQTIADTLEGMQGELQDKLRAVIAWGLDQSVLAEGTKQAAKRMADLAAAREKRAQAMFDYARNAMQATGLGEVVSDEFSAKLAKKPPSVLISDGAVIPAKYMRQAPMPDPVPDKKALADAMKAGEVFDGVALQAGYRLAIK